MARPSRYYFTGYNYQSRAQGIADITQAVGPWGAILDFKLFSDVVISFEIEVIAAQVHSLYASLAAVMEMEPFDVAVPETAQEVLVLMQVTFAKGTGNMRHEVPAVPG